jgi:hypothetical protein
MANRIGFFALVLFVYNLGRWYFTQRRVRLRREAETAARPRTSSHEEPPNPDFDFTDRPGDAPR